MKNTSELYIGLEKEEQLLQEYIDKRNKLIQEEKEIITNKSINDGNSYMSLSEYKKFSHNRNEEFMAKNNEIHSIEEKIKESSIKISKYELKLGKKKSKETKNDYSTLCDRMACEEQIRKSWIIGAYIRDYEGLRSNRLMLIDKIESNPNPNVKLLNDLKSELNIINDQLTDIELSRVELLKNMDVLCVNKNSLLDREKTLIKNKR